MRDTPNWGIPCEYLSRRTHSCAKRSHYAYRIYGGGWMMLCEQHGAKHHEICVTRTGGYGRLVDADGNPRQRETRTTRDGAAGGKEP